MGKSRMKPVKEPHAARELLVGNPSHRVLALFLIVHYITVCKILLSLPSVLFCSNQYFSCYCVSL